MKEELELKLQEDFLFMKQNRTEDGERNIYRRWGCECSSGWYQLIYDLCQEIENVYSKYDVSIDIEIQQIKEKFAGLRFYYSYKDSVCPIHAFDCLDSGTSIRFQPESKDTDDTTKILRREIANIVHAYEEKSKTICEICGQLGVVRMDMLWKRTLCEKCYNKWRDKIKA